MRTYAATRVPAAHATGYVFLLAGLCLLALIASSNAALAAVYTVDPDAFASGTLINNAFPGVTLTTMSDGAHGPEVYSLTDTFASTGNRVFAHSAPNPAEWGGPRYIYLRADFAGDASQVWADFIADDKSDSAAILRAFGADGTQVAMTQSVGTYTMGQVVSLSVSAPAISYVVLEGDPYNHLDAWRVDNLAYQPVPEPAAVLALLIGALGVPIVRRGR